MDSFSTVCSIIENFSGFRQKPAIINYQQGKVRTLSFADIKNDIEQLACGLSVRAIGKRDFVVLIAPNSPEWIITALGIIRAGAIVVPLNIQTDDRTIRAILKDLKPKLIFSVSGRLDPVLEDTGIARSSVMFLNQAEGEQSWRSCLNESRNPIPQPDSHDVAALFYTSGTMGSPKGVPLTHGNLCFQVNAIFDTQLVRSDDSFLLPLPLHHIYPFTVGMLLPMAAGTPILLPQSLSGPHIIRAVQQGNATILFGVPRLYSALHAAILGNIAGLPRTSRVLVETSMRLCKWLHTNLHIKAGALLLRPVRKRIGSRLRMLCCGGAAIDPEVGRDLESWGWPIAVGYGLTETAPLLTMRWPGRGRLDSVGHALPGIELRIDSQAWRSICENPDALSCGELERAGEIQARGPAITSGYLNLPDKTAQAFTQDGWFRTGDVGFLQNGELHVLGRMSSLIVTASGKKIDPEELESHYLVNTTLKEIGILRRNGRLVAVVVPDLDVIKSAGGGDIDRLVRDALDERALHLPTYKRLSGYVLTSEPLLRTAMGKLQRHTLEQAYDRLATGTSQQVAPEKQKVLLSEEDRALLEHPIANKVWHYLEKRYEPEHISLDSNPQLELNVDSLEWLTLALQIREISNVELDEEAIARITTIRDLLRELVQASDAELPVHEADPLEEPEKFIAVEDIKWLTPLNALQTYLQLIFYHLNRMLMRLLFRLEVVGLDNIPENCQFVLTPNHASFLDPFVLAAAIPLNLLRNIRWAAWTGIAFANPLNRFISRLAHAIPIDADHALMSSLAMGSEVLKQGQNLIWFPEGRRTLTGEIQPFKAGLGLVLQHYTVPAIPVFLDGTSRALPPGSWFIRPVKIRVIFGSPHFPQDLEAAGKGDKREQRITSALRQCVAQLNPTVQKGSSLQLTGPAHAAGE